MLLFVTYYLQQNLRFSAIAAGLAFLPMTFALATAAQLSIRKLLPKAGPRAAITPGLLLAAAGAFLLNTLAASAITSYAATHARTPHLATPAACTATTSASPGPPPSCWPPPSPPPRCCAARPQRPPRSRPPSRPSPLRPPSRPPLPRHRKPARSA
jgi:hypothetical protein